MKLFMFSALLVAAAVSSPAQQLYRIGWEESGVKQDGEAFRATPAEAGHKVEIANRIDPSHNRWIEDITPARPSLSPGMKRLYTFSFLALTAMQAADIASSYGRPEANPILANGSGRFGGRALAFKAGLVGGLEVTQLFMMRHNPSHAKRMAIINFAASAALSVVVVHNMRSTAR